MFEVTESKLSWNTILCMLRNTVVSSYCVFIIIRQLKSLKFQSKENYFQTNAAGFVNVFSGEKRENIKDLSKIRFASY